MSRLFFLFVVIFTGSWQGNLSGNDNPQRVMRSELAGAGLLPMTAKFCVPDLCESADLSALFGASGNFDPAVAKGVVDWVLVQAGTGEAEQCQTALLLENSRIVDPRAYIRLSANEKTRCLNGDGKVCPPLYFSGTDDTSPLYFSVKHHNHLGVRTSAAVAKNEAGLFVFDFGAAPENASQSECGNRNCLTAGDLDGDGSVDGEKDVQFFLNYQIDSGESFGYARADGDLDGTVNVEDVIRGVSPNLGQSGDQAACPVAGNQ